MKIHVPDPGVEPFWPAVQERHIFSGERCIYCNINTYDRWTDDDERCVPNDERVSVWTFEPGRNDMADFVENEQRNYRERSNTCPTMFPDALLDSEWSLRFMEPLDRACGLVAGHDSKHFNGRVWW